MKHFLLSLLALSIFIIKGYSNTDSLLNELNNTVNQVENYDNEKIHLIDSLKKALFDNSSINHDKNYNGYEALYECYRLFKYDSAYTYGSKLIQLAYAADNKNLIIEAKLKMSFIFLSSGLFNETHDSLNTINIYSSSDSIKAEYYTLWGRYYYDMGTYYSQFPYSASYDLKGNTYIDSALTHYSSLSFEYSYYKGLKYLKQSKADSAAFLFQKLMNTGTLNYSQLALTASTLSSILLQRNQTDSAIQLLALAAIADIKNSNKETFANFSLAELLFKIGKVKYASICIENAISNANTYGARQRKAQLSGILPLIEKERIDASEYHNRMLIKYAVAITSLFLVLIAMTVFITKQVKKLKELNIELADTNLKLAESNTKLADTNLKLAESNKKLEEANYIKEECVSYFFTLDSEIFSRLERLKTILEGKLSEKKPDEIKYIINSINLKEEKELLLQSFDKVFLRIYPNFINSFNEFFRSEDKIIAPENGLLNNDLRIFALIRMGIRDIDKIARILGYSNNTIYAYKSKIKNKAIVPNNEFEERLMTIK